MLESSDAPQRGQHQTALLAGLDSDPRVEQRSQSLVAIPMDGKNPEVLERDRKVVLLASHGAVTL